MKKISLKLSVLVPFFFILVYILPLGVRDLWSPDELRYAEIAREMVQTNNWVEPQFNHLRYFEKPIMGHWLNAAAQIVFGENNFSARISSALSSLGVAYCLFVLVAKFASRKQAWLSIAIYLSSFMVLVLGSYNTLDSMLSLWITAAFTCLYYAANAPNAKQKFNYYALAGIFCGFAFLTKGFLALALPVIVFVPFMFFAKKISEMFKYSVVIMFAAALVSLPWALMINSAEPDFWHYFFWVEHIKRFTASNAQHNAPFWYYLPVFMLATLPWLFLIPNALIALKPKLTNIFTRYALFWLLMPLFFFSMAKGKLPTYILPCLAPFAILLAQGITAAFKKHNNSFNLATKFNLSIFLILTVAVIFLMFKGRLPLDDSETYKGWFLAVALFSWSIFAFISLKVTSLESKVICYMLMPALLFLSISKIIPNKSIDSKMPARFIMQISPLVNANTTLVADYPSTMSALNWYLKRDDVFLTNGRGEVDYGLSYNDSKDRYIDDEHLTSFIKEKRQVGAVLLFFREMKKLPENIPKASEIFKRGRFTAIYYRHIKQDNRHNKTQKKEQLNNTNKQVN